MAGLGGLVGRLKAHLPKTRRGKILFYSAAGVLAVMMLGGGVVGIWSGYPSFCKSCHHIVPHYESWATSVHGKEEVTCTDCHFEPGMLPYVMGKVNGMVEVVKYVTGAYPTKLRSEVADVSCLREGCHSTDELKKKPLKVGKARFGHERHLGESLRGIHFRCATCHSTSLHSKSGKVSKRVCFTCHFKPGGPKETVEERKAREKLGKCEECHDVPDKLVTKAGLKFEHGKYAVPGKDCARCHGHITQGDGGAIQERCRFCHHEGTGHLDKYAETELVHENHVTEHQVACFECHAEIRHGKRAIAALGEGPCESCHAGFHVGVQKVYEGKGGTGVKDLPDPMLAAGVQCTGCHASMAAAGEVARKGGPREVTGRSCVDCHKKGYDKLASRWKTAFEGYSTKLDALLEKARAIDGSSPRAKRLLGEAAANLDLVRGRIGVHNVRYAALCLRHAQTALAEVLTRAGLKDAALVIPTYEEGAAKCFKMCHIGVETVGTLKYAKKEFPHAEHVLSPRASCSQCHTIAGFDEKQHGETAKATTDCNACHHKKEKAEGCESCHSLQAVVYTTKTPADPHANAAKKGKEEVTCESCHDRIAREHERARIRQLCVECHKNKKAYGKMLDEWQQGIREELEGLQRLQRKGRALLYSGIELSEGAEEALRDALAASGKAIDLVRRDGSGGAHNLEYLYSVVSGAAKGLTKALAAATK